MELKFTQRQETDTVFAVASERSRLSEGWLEVPAGCPNVDGGLCGSRRTKIWGATVDCTLDTSECWNHLISAHCKVYASHRGPFQCSQWKESSSFVKTHTWVWGALCFEKGCLQEKTIILSAHVLRSIFDPRAWFAICWPILGFCLLAFVLANI